MEVNHGCWGRRKCWGNRVLCRACLVRHHLIGSEEAEEINTMFPFEPVVCFMSANVGYGEITFDFQDVVE